METRNSGQRYLAKWNLADGVWALYFTGKGPTGPLDIAQIELG